MYLGVESGSVDAADPIDREILDLDLIDDARFHEFLVRGVTQRVGVVRVRLHFRFLLGADLRLGGPLDGPVRRDIVGDRILHS
jgi:hypothetical protein